MCLIILQSPTTFLSSCTTLTFSLQAWWEADWDNVIDSEANPSRVHNCINNDLIKQVQSSQHSTLDNLPLNLNPTTSPGWKIANCQSSYTSISQTSPTNNNWQLTIPHLHHQQSTEQQLYIIPVEFRGTFRELLPLQLHLKRLRYVWHYKGIRRWRLLHEIARRRFRPIGIERIGRLGPRRHFPLLQRANCRVRRRRQSPAEQRRQRWNCRRRRWHGARCHAAQPLIGLG